MAKDSLAVGDEPSFFGQIDLARPGLETVRKAVEKEDWDVAKVAWGKHLQERTSPHWRWSHRDKDRIKARLEKENGGLANHVPRAEKVLRREFSWLGVSKTLPHDFDWYKPDEYEHEWGNVLNRHGYWRTLAYAWWHTGDPKYAEDWVEMLHDWIDENPVKPQVRGPWRTLEVGGRCSSWFDLINLFMDAPAFDAEARYAITKSLVEHARLLYKDIKRKGFRKGNWQLTKAKGMATVGIMLPEFKEAEAWRELGFKILTDHMEQGVYPDGGHCELTPGYHFHCMNAFQKAVIIARANGYDIPGLADRHEKMFEFLMHLTKPDRAYVPVGDAGGGWDSKIFESMSLGAFLYDRRDMRYLGADDIRPSWTWQFPQDRLAQYAAIVPEEPSIRSHIMPHSKYAVMRTGWEKQDRWFFFDCAPWGGSHSHGDRLQVCLYSGRDLLVDPGQISYDRPLAKTYFRKAEAHNVLLLDEKDQPKSNPEVLSWNVEDRVEFVSGRIQTKDSKITHQRSVLFVKPDYWVVVDHVTGERSSGDSFFTRSENAATPDANRKGDEVTGDAAPKLTRLFHFPEVKVEQDARSAWTTFDEGENVWIGVADEARLEMRKGWIVPRRKAGKSAAAEAPVAAIVSDHPLPATFCTVIVPFRSKKDIPKIVRLKKDDICAASICVRFPNGRTDWIDIAAHPTALEAGGQEAEGIALCVRESGGKTTTDVIKLKPLKDE